AAGGVGVIRLSGPAALEAARTVVPALPLFPEPRHAYLVSIAGLDEGLVIHFPAPSSYTGEDVVELMPHGSPKLLSMVLRKLLEHPALRLAQAREVPPRAHMHSRLDH